jgi:hypothetical protein
MRSDYLPIFELAEAEFSEIIVSFKDLEHKIRFYLIDNSYIDVCLGGPRFSGRFSFHWERGHIDGRIYRYDNFPNTKWKKLESFPFHFHNGSQNRVIEAKFSKRPLNGFRDFMEWIRGFVARQKNKK